MASKIDWCDEVWNPLAGCSPVSPGCDNCYACRLSATRLKHMPDFKGLAEMRQLGPIMVDAEPVSPGRREPRWTGEVRLLPHKLEQPLRWRKPRRVFVVDKGDLFHAAVPNEYIAAVFGVMAACPQHTFVVLTKRPERMAEWFRWLDSDERLDSNGHTALWYPFAIEAGKYGIGCNEDMRQAVASHPGILRGDSSARGRRWPLPNVWLGVTCEDQQRADERIPLLLQTPAAVRWVSYEPGLGPLKLTDWWLTTRERCNFVPFTAEARAAHGEAGPRELVAHGIDWLVIGCESGPKARQFRPQWARDVADQCKAAGVPCFTKQLPEHRDGTGRLRKSAELAELGWPVQYPEPS